MQYGELYHRNYYKEVHEKNRVYYEYYHLDGTQEVPADYKEIAFVCLRSDGSLELPHSAQHRSNSQCIQNCVAQPELLRRYFRKSIGRS